MAEGKIRRLVSDRGFGFIRPEKNGEEVFFHSSVLKDTRFEDLQEGIAVVYESERGPKGPRATVVRLTGSTQGKEDYRFLNPYNFVRPLPQARPKDYVLGDCLPPPHDRYVPGLLTGRITCQVEVVTPLFVSDSHAVKVEDKKHKTFRFFEYDGTPALPATSLRGMIRSVFEAVTNSCFSVFTGARLSYRLEAGKSAALVPARVEKHEDGSWHLHLLTGFSPLNPGQRPKALYAATVHLYDPLRGKRIHTPKVHLNGLKHRDSCHALVEKKGIFTYVLQVGKTSGELDKPRGSQRIVSGWLCINNQNIENKRKDRLFFRASENAVGPAQISLPDDIRGAYEDLITDYQTRHSDAVDARNEAGQEFDQPIYKKREGKDDKPALSRYMYAKDDLKLTNGALVYAGLSGSMDRPRVDYIVPAAVPRVSYSNNVADLLKPEYLHHCKEYKTLCPACRTFGWVHDSSEEKQELSMDKIVAYAGRLRFSHATLIGDEGTMEPITLSILSSPKPTTTRFYLRPKRGGPQNGQSDAQVGYDGENVLRGRKFYRHHGKANPVEYKRATDAKHDGKDDQNRTVRGARKPGNRFQFTIDFHNLDPVELGALLWTLALEEDDWQGCHRLGYAKPLGFGSVRLEISDLKFMEPQNRYTSLSADGGWRNALSQKDQLVALFRKAMKIVYNQSITDLPNVRDLMTLLGEPPDLPIHYPRSPRPPDHRPDPEGKNFEWFVGNKRRHGPKVALALADDDTEGLPLIDRRGNVVHK